MGYVTETLLHFSMAFSGLIEATVSGVYDPAKTIALAILIISYVFYAFRRNAKLPPGPFSWPIIGNLHQLGNLPHRSLQDLSNKYGPIMYLRLGSVPTLVVSSAEMAKEVLTIHDLAFASRPPSAVGKHLTYNYKDMAFVPYGPYSRHVKKICNTELLSANRLESFRFIREEEVSLAMRSIWEKSEHGKIGVNVSKTIGSLISAIIWRMLVGRKFSEDEDLIEDAKGREFRDMVHEVGESFGAFNIGDFMPYIDWVDLQGVNQRMKKSNRFFDKVIQDIINEHIKVKDKQTSIIKDIIDVLLEMSESDKINMKADNIKATILILFIGGIDTTVTSLVWTMSEMVRNPRKAKKLQKEIESIVGKHRMVKESDLGSMEYLQCVVQESLRLYPPGPLLLPHESTKACSVSDKGFLIPPKTRLIVNAWAIARDSAVWEDPLSFMPERFVRKDIDIKGRDFNMLPFGAGRRACPGALMAKKTMKLVLAQLMHCFDWSVEGDPSELNMNETFGMIPRKKEDLIAIPALKVSNCL